MQDYLGIFLILPVVFVSGYLASTGREAAQFIWAGSLLYVLRTYTVFSYNAEFSILFFVYCLILSITFYSLARFFWGKVKSVKSTPFTLTNKILIISAYLIIYGSAFCFLVLLNIFKSFVFLNENSSPEMSAFKMHLDPTTVIDMAILAPAFMITGILLLTKNSFGRLISPVLLTLALFTNIAAGALEIILYVQNIRSGLWITSIMAVLAVINFLMLRAIMHNNQSKDIVRSEAYFDIKPIKPVPTS